MGHSTSREAAFFDLDKTIIAKSSTFAFSREFRSARLLSRRDLLRSAYSQVLFTLGGADHDRMEELREMTSAMVTGWDVGTVRQIVAETLETNIKPMVFDEALTLIRDHKAAGRDVIIISASGAELVEPIAAMLGADDAIATRMRIDDGRYSGQIEFYAYAEEKARAVRELARTRGYDLARSYAYSDSVTDVPMLAEVGHPHAVNPDKDLRRVAQERDWPTLKFTRPVAMRPAIPLPPAKPALAALAVTALAALLAAVLVTRKRRRLRLNPLT